MKPSHQLRTALAAAVAVLLVSATPAGAAPIPVLGGGSTFAFIALDQWRADVSRTQGLVVNYQPTGSGNGQIQFKAGVYDFASTDISLLTANRPAFGFTYLPIVAGGTALFYNVTDAAGQPINNIRLSSPTIARIWTTTEAMTWDDPMIKADNPGLANRLPNKALIRVGRSEQSGSTAVFYTYISRIAGPAWNNFSARNTTYENDSGRFVVEFDPGFREAGGNSWRFERGSDGVAQAVSSGGGVLNQNGFIGYAETGFAVQKKLPIAFVRNAAGNWVLPTPRNVAVALLEATRSADGTQNLSGVALGTRPEAYPLSSYNYLVVKTDPPAADDPGRDTALGKGETIGRYVKFAVTEGQRKAANLDYSPLPPNLVQQALDEIRKIPGAPDPGPLGDWGKYYLDLDVQKVDNSQATTGGGNQGGTAAGAPGAGAAAGAKGRTTTTVKRAAGGGAAARGGAAAGTAGTAGAASDPNAPVDPNSPVEVADGGTIDGETAETAGFEGSESLLEPTSAELASIRTPAPVTRLPFGIFMLVLVFIPPAIMAFQRRKRSPGASAGN